MKKIVILLFLMGFIKAEAQFYGVQKSFRDVRLKSFMPDFRQLRSAPVFTTLPENFTSSYWQVATYTRYSINGRLRSTYSFDVHGVIRESGTSFSLKKSGALSYWRVQVSPQRSRPLFIYTIH